MLPDDSRIIFNTGPLLERLVPPEVNEEASHLLKFLLDMNTRRRLTVPQALGHAFFGGCPQLPTAAASVERGASTDNSIGNFDQGAIDFRYATLVLPELKPRVPMLNGQLK